MAISYFAELLTSIATLNVLVYGAPSDAKFQFKSEDGSLFLEVLRDGFEIFIITLRD